MSDRVAATSLLIAAAALLHAPCDARERLAARIAHAALARAGKRARWLRCLTLSRLGRPLLLMLERILLPGLAAHYRWRKRHIACWAEACIADGATQLLVLGAGFDALAAHLVMQYPSLVAIEIDRTPAIVCKRAALIEAGFPPAGTGLHHMELDLSSQQALRDATWPLDPRADTVIVAEGVLMYLAQDEVRGLCATLASHFTGSLRVIGTAMERTPHGIGFARQSGLVAHWLRRQGEPFRWGLEAARTGEALASLGLQLETLGDPHDPRDPDPAPGERMFLARPVR